MGSGCNSSIPGFSSGGLVTKPDTSIKYTGDPIPSLGICTGDTLAEVDAVILQEIISFATGQGIMISGIDLAACALFVTNITCCNGPDTVPKALADLIKMIFTALCTLYTDYTSLKTLVDALLNGPYDTGCLTLSANPTLNQIIQELLTEFCTLVGRVTALETAVSTLSSGLSASIGNFLNSAIITCQTDAFIKSGTGASFTLTLKGALPIGSISMYGGPITGVFDFSGKGFNPGPACGWALCNGGNGTIDMRGFSPVGVNDGTMGAGAQIDPVNNSVNPGQNYALGNTAGNINHRLSPSEIPPTPVTISDPGHTHAIVGKKEAFKPGDGDDALDAKNPSDPGGTPWFSPSGGGIVGTDFTGITATVGGGGLPHDIRQPIKAVYFIQRIA